MSGISAPVTGVKLRLFCTDAAPAGGIVFPTSSGWTETGLTWNTAPGATGAALRTIGAVAVGTWVEVDLTGHVSADGTVNLLIRDGNTNSAYYSSREGTAPPQLVITYAD